MAYHRVATPMWTGKSPAGYACGTSYLYEMTSSTQVKQGLTKLRLEHKSESKIVAGDNIGSWFMVHGSQKGRLPPTGHARGKWVARYPWAHQQVVATH